ncbi:MAG: acylphosphatase [Lachnospiraceae bacterium]|jgi:acylphosphatase|nr:acylphosphatase [Lachnospiraceae bacterium]MCI1327878.1 acylphosphatase [Lachnospiraceae bacterium]
MIGKIVRRRLTFSGTVQGVGFRWRAKTAASSLGLTGWVENRRDGSVVMEVQGTQHAITRLILTLKSARYIEIDSVRNEPLPVVEKENGFTVHSAW